MERDQFNKSSAPSGHAAILKKTRQLCLTNDLPGVIARHGAKDIIGKQLFVN